MGEIIDFGGAKGPPNGEKENVGGAETLRGSMRRHWKADVRPPQFHEAVRRDHPGVTLAEFNAAADSVWVELSQDERPIVISVLRVKDGWLVDGAGGRVRSFSEVTATMSGETGWFVGVDDEGGFIFKWEGVDGFEVYPQDNIPPIAVAELDESPF